MFAALVFLSAFLLFQVQPIEGRFVLPWFGGTPAVWTTCLLFFQAALLGGYLYAHVLSTRFSLRAQTIVHASLLLLSLLLLPIVPSAMWKPEGGQDPVGRIFVMLSATVGAPYFLLSATAPLLQRWFGAASAGAPWRLYAVSNLGSFLALLSYPIVVEKLLPLRVQSAIWSIAYAAFALLVCALTWRMPRWERPLEKPATGLAEDPGVRPPSYFRPCH